MLNHRILRPLLILVGMEVLLLVLVLVLPGFIFERSWVTDFLVVPNYRRRDLAEFATSEVIAGLNALGLRTWLCGSVAALLWLLMAMIHRPSAPGEAGTIQWRWVSLGGLAVSATVLNFYLPDGWIKLAVYMLPDKHNELLTYLLLLCLLAYHPFGTFLATPRLHRPAVPFSNMLTHS